ncbi:MAG: hypothetical protein DBY41_07145 [Clostridium sp.]|nr:MAG: hypothetical protein DBY41_07145 [Clostridium sp.]
MVKFGDAVNLFCTYIKTVLMLFIVNFLISIPVGFIIGICSIIPLLNIVLSIIYMMITIYVTICTFIECQQDMNVDFSTILNYYFKSFDNLGDLFKACLIPFFKMFGLILIVSVIYFTFMSGSIMLINSITGISVLLLIFTLFAYIFFVMIVSLKYTIEIYQKISCVYFNDNDFKFYESNTGKTPKSRYFWFLVPIIGNFLIPLAITSEAIDYYHTKDKKFDGIYSEVVD